MCTLLLTATFVCLDPQMSNQSQPPAAWKAAKPFVNGGLSGMLATCIIQPIDMVKVRIQLGAKGSPVSQLRISDSGAGARLATALRCVIHAAGGYAAEVPNRCNRLTAVSLFDQQMHANGLFGR